MNEICFANRRGLTNKTCVACKVGAPLETENEINEFKQQLPNGVMIEKDGIKRLK